MYNPNYRYLVRTNATYAEPDYIEGYERIEISDNSPVAAKARSVLKANGISCRWSIYRSINYTASKMKVGTDYRPATNAELVASGKPLTERYSVEGSPDVFYADVNSIDAVYLQKHVKHILESVGFFLQQ